MDSIINETLVNYLKFAPVILWSLFLGILEWIVPKSWYAKDVREDIVLITGAGSGLGRAIALEFAKLNSSLVLWDVNEKGLQETKILVQALYEKNAISKNNDKQERECTTYLVDVSDKDRVHQAGQEVRLDLNKERKIDEPERYVSVLVNNAGIYHGLMLQDLKDDQIERIFKVNILAHFWTVRTFLPDMIKHERGHIVEIASMGGIAGLLKQVDYCATKFATVGFEESLSIELDHLGLSDKIHTTIVCPLFFSSNLFTGFDTSVAPLMTTDFVARETVMAMRCNHSRLMLPKFGAYALYAMRTYMTRRLMIQWTRVLGFAEGIREIKGQASTGAIA